MIKKSYDNNITENSESIKINNKKNKISKNKNKKEKENIEDNIVINKKDIEEIEETNEKKNKIKRYFKCLYLVDGIVNSFGRYKGSKPKQAAKKALNGIANIYKNKGIDIN